MPIQHNQNFGTNDCPSSTVWISFLDGRVDDPLLNTLSDHLETCEDCLQEVERLSSQDGLSDSPVSPSPFVNERCCIRLLETLKKKGLEHYESVSSLCPISTAFATTPERIGRYEIGSVLGTGGFGCVYLANDPLLNRKVAIKAPRFNFRSERQKAQFLSEARQVASLDHPGIVQVYDVIDDSVFGSPVIVMKHISGTPLSTLLRTVKLKPDEAVRFIIQIAKAVHSAHQQGVIHRDLKPSNILIDETNHPFVTDFGLSVNLFNSAPELSCAGGTPQYMSPEQITATLSIDARSDVWSLGVILAEMIHGTRPFPQNDRQALFDSIINEEPRIKSTPQTAELDAIVRRCLSKQPSDRFASSEELASNLSLWLRRNFPVGNAKLLYGWRRNVLLAFAISLSIVVSLSAWYATRIGNIRSALNQLEASPIDQVAMHLDRVRKSGATVQSVFTYPTPANDSGRLRIALASIALGDKSNEIGAILAERLMSAQPEEIKEVIQSLRDAKQTKWGCEFVLKYFKDKGEAYSLPIGAVVAGLNPKHDEWKRLESDVVAQILKLPERDMSAWLGLLDPIGKPRLSKLFRQIVDTNSLGSHERMQAMRALGCLFRADVNALTSLVSSADLSEIHVLLPNMENQKAAMIASMSHRFDLLIERGRSIKIEDSQSPAKNDLELANLAISLFMLGHTDSFVEAIQHSSDPTLQSLVIYGLGQQRLSSTVILKILQQYRVTTDSRSIAIRFCLLQVLSLMDVKNFDPGVDWSIVQDLWIGDSDCGVHSSARSAAFQIGMQLHPLVVGEYGNWRVDSIGSGTQDFVVIEPCETEMGSLDPRDSPLGVTSWNRHLRVIPRQYAISTTEVTIRQFRDLMPNFPMTGYMLVESEEDSAMVIKELDSAYQFCNRLSESAGFESCYQLVEIGTESRWEPKGGHLEMSGYRLPTDGEWELACRAGTSTSRYFGNAHFLVGLYGWVSESSRAAKRNKLNALLSQRPAMYLPNRLGLFDFYGNAKELCDMSTSPAHDVAICVDEIVPHDESFLKNYPLLRGCSHTEKGSVYAKSHARTNRIKISTDPSVGFRLARTIRNTSIYDLDRRAR